MCGLVGIFGDGFERNKTLFEELLYINYLRGPHSTGVAFINDKYVQVVKDPVSPDDLTYYKRYQKAMQKKDHIGLMGHGRFATRGKVEHANAHPFNHGTITLTHNGTCSSVDKLPGKFDTDSETICHAINEWGATKVWDKLEWCNPGTIVFWDAKAKTFNMITNGSRPMFFSFIKGKGAIIYASEDWMYKGVCEHNKVDLELDEEGIGTYFLKKDHLYSFKYNKATKTVTFDMTEVKFTKPAHSYYNSGQSDSPFRSNNTDTQERWRRSMGGFQRTTSTTIGRESDRVVGPIARINVDNFKDKIGALPHGLTVSEFRDKYQHCLGCEHSLHDEYPTCFIMDDRHAFCDDCITGFISLGIDPVGKMNMVS